MLCFWSETRQFREKLKLKSVYLKDMFESKKKKNHGRGAQGYSITMLLISRTTDKEKSPKLFWDKSMNINFNGACLVASYVSTNEEFKG